MVFFDVRKDWVIFAPFSVPAARRGGAELSAYIGLLRQRAGAENRKPPAVQDAGADTAPDAAALILLNPGDGGSYRNGFSWRLGEGRLEIYGDSERGLWNGIFDFLGALGLRWPDPDREELPSPAAGVYPLRESRARQVSAPSAAGVSRLIVDEKTKPADREALIRWAARNRIDALIRPFRDRRLKGRKLQKRAAEAADYYALVREAGGRELSLLVPRRLFFFHRDLFRMESGRRVRDYNFCPTNPETIGILKKKAAKLFDALLCVFPGIPVFHLWPGRGHENAWCACPACRAFGAADQYRIAVNAAADALAALAPAAKISLYETPGEAAVEDGRNNIPLRANVFRLDRLPDEDPPLPRNR
ncbi:MAG: hypothetical protein LBK27_06410 [Treponema sp.]|jgi:hypothetical protein|nr:hypothetical protein [Treponema sp.]